MERKSEKAKPVNQAKYFDITPEAFSLLTSLREMGYTTNDAVLDLIDNSLEAGATRIDVMIRDVSGGKRKDFVIDVLDNGSGMDAETLQSALRLGNKREYKADALGRFGMGLKTASLSLGKSIRVLSRKEGQVACQALLDMDDIERHNEFKAQTPTVHAEELMQLGLDKNGTLVSISKIDRIDDTSTFRFHEALRENVGRVYREFIAKGVKFKIGPHYAKRFDPLMLDNPLTEVKLDTDLVFAPGKVARLKVVELPEDDSIRNGDSGFYLVRNGREIRAAETFGIRPLHGHHHTLGHFRAELRFTSELDAFLHVNVKKNFVQLDDNMLKKLDDLVHPFLTESASKPRETRVPPILSIKAHEQATRLIEGNQTPQKGKPVPRISFTEESKGESAPMFEAKGNNGERVYSYNRDHPFLKFVAEEAVQRPALVLNLLTHAISNAADNLPNGADFLKSLETALLSALKNK